MALWTTAGSVLGSLVIAIVVRHFGMPAIELLVGEGALRQPSWLRLSHLLNRYGGLTLFFAAIGPIPLLPVSILSGAAEIPYFTIFAGSLLGRLPKYLVISWISAKSPQLLQRKWVKRYAVDQKDIVDLEKPLPPQ